MVQPAWKEEHSHLIAEDAEVFELNKGHISDAVSLSKRKHPSYEAFHYMHLVL